MFVEKVLTDKGIYWRGRYGIDKIDVDISAGEVTCYTVGGNIFSCRLKRILIGGNGVVVNSRNHHKNLYL